MLKVIKSKKNIENIILFIHGFIGGEETWIKEDDKKPIIDLLLENEIIDNNFDIGLFTYHTKLANLFPNSKKLRSLFSRKKHTSNLPIRDITNLLSTQIRLKCKSYKRIILIGHSMGGLIAKSYVLSEIENNDKPKVKLYISLATPHSGSDWATFGKKIIGNVQIDDLAPLGESITRLNHDWVKCKTLPSRFYVQGLNDQVVPKESSIPPDREEQNVFYTDDDHFSIIIPENAEDTVINALTDELIDFSNHHQKKTEVKVDVVSKKDGLLEKKIFVENEVGQKLNFIHNQSLKSFTGQPTIFVSPILSKTKNIGLGSKSQKEKYVEADYLVDLPKSTIIKGPPQFGLTCLSNYLRMKAWDTSSSVWLSIDFKEIKLHQIQNAISNELDFFSCDITDVKCIIIDSWNTKAKNSIKFLNKVCNNYKRVPIIVMQTTEDSDFFNQSESETIDREFDVLHLLALPRTSLRKIISNYNDANYIGDEDEVLNKIITDLDGLNLHRTALNCITLLKVSEKYFDTSPVNRSEMIRMILFMLFNMDDIPTYKERPDLKDCEFVLGRFCEKLIRDNVFSFTREFIISELKNCCKERVIDLEVEVVFDILFKNNIIIQRGLNFSFRYSYWVYYFAAQQMQQNSKFANYIIKEKYYVSFPEILEFYTGIDRSRSDALAILIDDLKLLRETIEQKVGLPANMDLYKHAKWVTTKEIREKMKNELQEKVLNSKLPESVKDQYADLNYDRVRPYNQTINKFYENYSLGSLIQTLKAASRALRNSDYVDPKIKHELLKEIQLGWEFNMKILLVLSPTLARNGSAIYDNHGYVLVGFENMTFEESLNSIIHFIPTNIINWYSEDLYSPKMGSLLFEQIKNEEDDLRKHVLILLVVHKRPRKWKKCIQNYMSNISKNSYYLLNLLQALEWQYQFSFVTPSELGELGLLIKSCYAKHEFGGRKPTSKNITRIPDKVLPDRFVKDDEKQKHQNEK